MISSGNIKSFNLKPPESTERLKIRYRNSIPAVQFHCTARLIFTKNLIIPLVMPY